MSRTTETESKDSDPLLVIRDLQVDYFTRRGRLRAVDGVDLEIHRGEVLGLAGESGAGKTALAYSILRLLPRLEKRRGRDFLSKVLRFLPFGGGKVGEEVTLERGEIVGGEIRFQGRNLLDLSEEEMGEIRGKRISMIFQNPVPSLDPLQVSGLQTGEALEAHGAAERSQIRNLVFEYLGLVRFSDVRRIYRTHPGFLSGGEGQRVMIASSLICSPDLVIADEPTSNLDVTVQRNIMDLLNRMKERFDLTVLLITHDLGVIAEAADRITIMYAGKIVESGHVHDVLRRPRHPYTRGLLAGTPRLGLKERLEEIPGGPPDPFRMPAGCRFHPRCRYAVEACREEVPGLVEVGVRHLSACLRVEEIGDQLDLT